MKRVSTITALAIIGAIALVGTRARAEITCPDYPPVQDSRIEGAIKGSVSGLVRLIGSAELDGKAIIEKKRFSRDIPTQVIRLLV